jgi:hypothetical protein
LTDQVYDPCKRETVAIAVTFTPQSGSLVHVERLYRAMTILNGEPIIRIVTSEKASFPSFLLSDTISLAAQELPQRSGTSMLWETGPVVFNLSRDRKLYSIQWTSRAKCFWMPTTKTTFSGTGLEIVATGLGYFLSGTCRETPYRHIQPGIPIFPLCQAVRQSLLNRPQNSPPIFLHDRRGEIPQ